MLLFHFKCFTNNNLCLIFRWYVNLAVFFYSFSAQTFLFAGNFYKVLARLRAVPLWKIKKNMAHILIMCSKYTSKANFLNKCMFLYKKKIEITVTKVCTCAAIRHNYNISFNYKTLHLWFKVQFKIPRSSSIANCTPCIRVRQSS